VTTSGQIAEFRSAVRELIPAGDERQDVDEECGLATKAFAVIPALPRDSDREAGGP